MKELHPIKKYYWRLPGYTYKAIVDYEQGVFLVFCNGSVLVKHTGLSSEELNHYEKQIMIKGSRIL